MNNTLGIVGLALLVVGSVGFMAWGAFGGNNKESPLVEVEGNGILATVYKSPTCGCCGVFADYMEDKGYTIAIENVANMSTVKSEYGVPNELESCHTTIVGGYVVEGHIPEEAIQKLLEEQPDIKGIGMAGMPSGSPGMPGPKNDDFVIYEITHDNTKGEVFMVI